MKHTDYRVNFCPEPSWPGAFLIPSIFRGLLNFQQIPGFSGLWVRYRTAQIWTLQNWIVAIFGGIKGVGNFRTPSNRPFFGQFPIPPPASPLRPPGALYPLVGMAAIVGRGWLDSVWFLVAYE